MHNRNRATPIALTRQAPVAQAVLGDTFANAVGFAPVDCIVYSLLASHNGVACEEGFHIENLFIFCWNKSYIHNSLIDFIGGWSFFAMIYRFFNPARRFKSFIWYIVFVCSFWYQKSRNHRQPVFAGKIQIALVMCRTGENRAGAVSHQDKVGDPDRQGFVRINRVLHGQAGVKTLLLGLFHRRFGGVHAATFGVEFGQRRIVDLEGLGQRVIG